MKIILIVFMVFVAGLASAQESNETSIPEFSSNRVPTGWTSAFAIGTGHQVDFWKLQLGSPDFHKSKEVWGIRAVAEVGQMRLINLRTNKSGKIVDNTSLVASAGVDWTLGARPGGVGAIHLSLLYERIDNLGSFVGEYASNGGKFVIEYDAIISRLEMNDKIQEATMHVGIEIPFLHKKFERISGEPAYLDNYRMFIGTRTYF